MNSYYYAINKHDIVEKGQTMSTSASQLKKPQTASPQSEETDVDKDRGLYSQTAITVNRFFEELNVLYYDIAKYYGLSNSAFDILYALNDEDGRRVTDLAKAAFMSKQTLSSSLKRLEDDGLVKTQAQSRKFVCVFLTDKGKERIRKSILPLVEAEIEALKPFTPKELSQLQASIDKYLTSLRKELRKLKEPDRQWDHV